MTTPTSAPRVGGDGRARREIGVDENFFAGIPVPRSPFPVPR